MSHFKRRATGFTMRLASFTYHTLIIQGEVCVLGTAVWGLSGWAAVGAVLLVCAGLLTLIYPHVGIDPRYARWVWGTPRRAVLPWVALLWLGIIVLVQAVASLVSESR